MSRGPAKTLTVLSVLAAATALLLAGAVDARGLAAPRASGPPNGASLPAFSWRPVRGAESYEFQIAADRSFNSSLPGIRRARFGTLNTRATVTKAVPNGRYWWRVRAVTKNGQVSGWSQPRSVRKSWTSAPRLLGPVGGAHVSFPSPLVLTWAPVPRASHYLVSLATDSDLATLVGSTRGQAIKTAGTSFAPSLTPTGRGKTY